MGFVEMERIIAMEKRVKELETPDGPIEAGQTVGMGLEEVLKRYPGSLVDADRVVLHYRCCECKVTITIPLKELPAGPFVCDECIYIENFMEMVAVGIKAE